MTVTDAVYVQTSIERASRSWITAGVSVFGPSSTLAPALARGEGVLNAALIEGHYQRLAAGAGSERGGPFWAGR